MSRRRTRRLVVPAPRDPAAAGHHERGVVSVQIVVLMPALFLLMFVGMQAALIYHARTVAIAAAQEGARAAAAQTGTTSDGHAAASAFVASAGGPDVLRSVTVTSNRGAATATVRVTGTTLSVVPGWVPSITQSASAPVERLTR
jgi:Flp pilus assembly protein TadG